MPSNKDDIWYFCGDCNSFFQDKKRIIECRSFGHLIRRRKPLRLRIVHKADETISEFITVDVDGDKWNCLLRLSFFKTDERGKTFHLSNVILNTPLSNIIRQLNHIFPDIKITEEKLIKLLKDAIVKNVYSEVSETSIKILLTLDEWLLLKPRTANSKLVYTSHSKIVKLTKKQPKTTVYANPVR